MTHDAHHGKFQKTITTIFRGEVRMAKRYLAAVQALLATCVVGSPISAAEPPDTSQQATSPKIEPERDKSQYAGEESGQGLGEIVVTARKRSERLIDVPAAIAVLDSNALARYSTTTFDAVGEQIPQVQFSRAFAESAGGALVIRGIGSNVAGDDSIDQSVGFNIDGVSTSRGGLENLGLFDINNIEVLKGPQALYYGKSSPAGVIVVDSNNPGDVVEGYAKAGYEFKARENHVEAAIGGPVNEEFGLRAAFFRSDMQGGYVKNVAPYVPAASNPVPFYQVNDINLPGASYKWGPGTEQTAGRLTALFHPNDDFDVNVKFLAADYRDNGESSVMINNNCGPGGKLNVDLGAILITGMPNIYRDPYATCTKDWVQSLGAAAPITVKGWPDSNGGDEYSHYRTYLGTGTINYHIDAIKFTSVSSYLDSSGSDFDQPGQSALIQFPVTYINEDRLFTQELRAATQLEGPLNGTLGAFYGNETRSVNNFNQVWPVADPVLGLNAPLWNLEGLGTGKGKTYSAFVEVDWKIAPNLILDAGGRFTQEQRSGTLQQLFISRGFALLESYIGAIAAPQGTSLAAETTSNNFSPQATLTYHPSDNTTLYVGYRSGFKSGGIANPGLLPPGANDSNIVYKPETARGYEAGLKFTALDHRFYGDVAIYHYTFSDLQVSAYDVTTFTLNLTNAASADTDGIEGTFSFDVTREFSTRASFGYNKARYTSFPNSQCWGGQTVSEGCVGGVQNLAGQPLSRAPELTMSTGFTWDHPVSSSWAFMINSDLRYSSWYNAGADNNPYNVQPAYVVLDGSINLHTTDNKWEISVIGKNLTDKFYYLLSTEMALTVQPGTVYALPGNPRTVEVQLGYRFQ